MIVVKAERPGHLIATITPREAEVIREALERYAMQAPTSMWEVSNHVLATTMKLELVVEDDYA